MLKFDIYKVSILINYKTKQPSNLAWNIFLASLLCDIGVRFFVLLSICLSIVNIYVIIRAREILSVPDQNSEMGPIGNSQKPKKTGPILAQY